MRYIESKNKDQKHKGWFYDHNTKNFYRWDLFITISKFVVSMPVSDSPTCDLSPSISNFIKTINLYYKII